MKALLKHAVMAGCMLFAFLIFPVGVFAAETILQLRTMEDPSVTVDDAFCAAAPFTSNVRLGAKVWTYQTRASDGEIVNDQVREAGTARACVLITDIRFTPFSDHPFYIRFDLGDASYTGLGICTVATNSVPMPGLILASCTLQLSHDPNGNLVGSAVSSSVFNPRNLPGFNTGSYWTLHLLGGP